MITVDALKAGLRLLTGSNLGNTPTTKEAGAAWSAIVRDLLTDWTDDDYHRALRAHVADPARGRWWPTPADLVAQHRASTPSPESLDALAWDTVVGRIARHGRRGARLVDYLDPRHLRALARVGGSWEVSRADAYQASRLRARFIAAATAEREHGSHLQLAAQRAPRIEADAPEVEADAPRRMTRSEAAEFFAEVNRRRRARRDRGDQ